VDKEDKRIRNVTRATSIISIAGFLPIIAFITILVTARTNVAALFIVAGITGIMRTLAAMGYGLQAAKRVNKFSPWGMIAEIFTSAFFFMLSFFYFLRTIS